MLAVGLYIYSKILVGNSAILSKPTENFPLEYTVVQTLTYLSLPSVGGDSSREASNSNCSRGNNLHLVHLSFLSQTNLFVFPQS